MKLEEITAVILCGGLGRRLDPLLSGIPKSMVSIGGTPFLELLLNYIVNQGIRKIILCLGFKADVIIKHFERNNNVEIQFSQETDLRGTAGALKNAESLIQDFPVLVMNGDTHYSVNLHEFLKFHKIQKGLATVVVTKAEERQDGGRIGIDEHFRVTSFEEKPSQGPVEYLSAGMYLFERQVFDRIPCGISSLEREILPVLPGERVFSFLVDTPQFDIGTPERLDSFRKMFLATSPK